MTRTWYILCSSWVHHDMSPTHQPFSFWNEAVFMELPLPPKKSQLHAYHPNSWTGHKMNYFRSSGTSTSSLAEVAGPHHLTFVPMKKSIRCWEIVRGCCIYRSAIFLAALGVLKLSGKKKTLDWPALKKTYQSDESKWEFVATITSQQATKFPVKTNKTTECCHKFRRIFKSHLVNAWRFKTRNSPNSHPFFWLKIGTWEVKISHHHILGCGTPPKRTIRSSPAEAAIQLLLAPEQVEASMCIVFVMRCKFKKSYSLTWDRSSKKNKLLFNYATWKSWILTEIQRNLSGFSGPSMLSNSYFVGAQIV